jgi:hypothetical protein
MGEACAHGYAVLMLIELRVKVAGHDEGPLARGQLGSCR